MFNIRPLTYIDLEEGKIIASYSFPKNLIYGLKMLTQATADVGILHRRQSAGVTHLMVKIASQEDIDR